MRIDELEGIAENIACRVRETLASFTRIRTFFRFENSSLVLRFYCSIDRQSSRYLELDIPFRQIYHQDDVDGIVVYACEYVLRAMVYASPTYGR